MKKLMLIFGLLFSCSQGSKPINVEAIKEKITHYEIGRWKERATPKNFEFSTVNDSTFRLRMELLHPMLKKEVEYTYEYIYASNIDSITSSELVKRKTRNNGTWTVDFDLTK